MSPFSAQLLTLRIGELMRCQRVLKGTIHHPQSQPMNFHMDQYMHPPSGFSSNVRSFNRLGSFPLSLVQLGHHAHGGGEKVQAAPWYFHDHREVMCCVVLSPSEKCGGHEQHFWVRVHGEQERGQAGCFSLFDMMVAIERGREEGFIQSLLGRAAGSHGV